MEEGLETPQVICKADTDGFPDHTFRKGQLDSNRILHFRVDKILGP